MTILAGGFLVVHGVIHLAIWLPEPREDAPFDPHRSWLLAEVRTLARLLAIIAGAMFVLAGILVLAGAGLGASLAVAGAAISLALMALTFNRWLVGAIAINVTETPANLGPRACMITLRSGRSTIAIPTTQGTQGGRTWIEQRPRGAGSTRRSRIARVGPQPSDSASWPC